MAWTALFLSRAQFAAAIALPMLFPAVAYLPCTGPVAPSGLYGAQAGT